MAPTVLELYDEANGDWKETVRLGPRDAPGLVFDAQSTRLQVYYFSCSTEDLCSTVERYSFEPSVSFKEAGMRVRSGRAIDTHLSGTCVLEKEGAP